MDRRSSSPRRWPPRSPLRPTHPSNGFLYVVCPGIRDYLEYGGPASWSSTSTTGTPSSSDRHGREHRRQAAEHQGRRRQPATRALHFTTPEALSASIS